MVHVVINACLAIITFPTVFHVIAQELAALKMSAIVKENALVSITMLENNVLPVLLDIIRIQNV